jgi:predicted component of type VI protein secretion system
MEEVTMPEGKVLTLRLSMMGRPVRSYTFGKPTVTVGRDPDADVFIDNPGVSREHLRFERTADNEYEVVDVGSANGTFLNDLPVRCKIILRNGDNVRFGKYSLGVRYDDDRRTIANQPPASPEGELHTVVLSRNELSHLLELQRKAEVAPPAAGAARASVADAMSRPVEDVGPGPATSAGSSIASAAVGFLIGAATGAIAMWFVAR